MYLRGDWQRTPQSAFYFSRELNDKEVARRIQIIFARLIYNANVIILLDSFIGQDRINLADDQILAVLVFEANCISGGG